MAIPTITPLPPAPTPSDAPDVFANKAGVFVTAEVAMVPQINTSLTWMGQQVTTIDGYRQAAAQSATDASGYASAANVSKSAAAQSATDAAAARDSAQAFAAAAGSAAGLPSIAGNAGKSLVVNANANGVEWGQGLPSLTGNARKPLAPNAGATASIWSDELSIPKYLDKIKSMDGAATQVLDLSKYSIFDISIQSVAISVSLSNIPSLPGYEECSTIVVRVRQSATPRTVTWFPGITWLTSGGVVPATPAANQIIEYIFTSYGTGSVLSWLGRVGAST